MRKIPKTLKIGGHTIKVLIKKLESGNDGESNSHENTITLDARLPASQMEATLIHEAFHMMNATWSGSREGHMFLESLSQQTYQFLSDNKLWK